MSRPAVLLDRDGTIIEERNYLGDPDGVVLISDAVEGLRIFAKLGYLLIVISNQSGVGRGYFTVEAVHAVNSRIAALLEDEGVHIDGWYICPHTPDQGCDCRKPATGLAERAAREQGLDLSRSIVIGDKFDDMALARAVGGTGILVLTGNGSDHAAQASAEGFQVCADLRGAAAIIAQRLRS